jgi:hypothetical protein
MPAFSQARWFNRTEVTEMGKKENKKGKEQSDLWVPRLDEGPFFVALVFSICHIWRSSSLAMGFRAQRELERYLIKIQCG